MVSPRTLSLAASHAAFRDRSPFQWRRLPRQRLAGSPRTTSTPC